MSDMQTTNDLIAIIRQRADAGLKKYGVTLDRKDLTTAIRAAIQLLVLGDTQGAADVLAACLPDGEGGEVVLVRDAGGA